MRIAALVIAAAFWTAPASAAMLISSTHIDPGQSVVLNWTGDDPWPVFDPPALPGATAYWSVIDTSTTSLANINAPGSEQGAFFNFFQVGSYSSTGIDIRTATFTYNLPGTYTIDYSYSVANGIYGQYQYYDANLEPYEGNGYWGQLLQFSEIAQLGDAGSFTVTVGSVPEPSTWAMMILGFAGMGFVAHRRKYRGSHQRSL